MAKVIVVFGATGNQGGSVARALLNDPKCFKVRCVTRNPNSEKARALADLGAEVVEASLDDPPTIAKAVADCYGVFGVTNYWEYTDTAREVTQGKALVDACKDAGVQHLVFSLFQSVKDDINVVCPHLEGKADIEKYLFASGVPCTSVRYPLYMENLLGGPLAPKRQHDGSYSLVIPMDDTPFGLLSVREAGQAVATIFRCPDRYFGKAVGFVGDKKTVKQMADILSKHLAPKSFRPSSIPLEQYGRMGFPGADDLAVMFDFFKRGNHKTDLYLTRHLDPGTKTFEEWVVANKDALHSALVRD